MKYFIYLEYRHYGICQKHRLSFEYVEQEFASRYDVINEMFKIQFDRRNMTSRTKTYLVGKRYLIEKNANGGDRKSVRQNDALIQKDRSSKIIGDQLNIGSRTVERAAEFTQAVDKIVQLTGIVVNDILNGEITDPMDKIKDLADKDPHTIVRIIDCVVIDKISVASATARIEKEDYNRQTKEAEERRKQVDQQLREKREAEEAKERERLRIEHEARVKQENKLISTQIGVNKMSTP